LIFLRFAEVRLRNGARNCKNKPAEIGAGRALTIRLRITRTASYSSRPMRGLIFFSAFPKVQTSLEGERRDARDRAR